MPVRVRWDVIYNGQLEIEELGSPSGTTTFAPPITYFDKHEDLCVEHFFVVLDVVTVQIAHQFLYKMVYSAFSAFGFSHLLFLF